ncbi:g7341 [Coccomyxa elongata]
MYFVPGVIFEALDPSIGSSGDPRGAGSHHDHMIYDKTGTSMKVKLWASTLWPVIEMLNAKLAANPGGVVVNIFAFGRDAYQGSVSLKSLDQSQLHVCDESEITTALWAVLNSKGDPEAAHDDAWSTPATADVPMNTAAVMTMDVSGTLYIDHLGVRGMVKGRKVPPKHVNMVKIDTPDSAGMVNCTIRDRKVCDVVFKEFYKSAKVDGLTALYTKYSEADCGELLRDITVKGMFTCVTDTSELVSATLKSGEHVNLHDTDTAAQIAEKSKNGGGPEMPPTPSFPPPGHVASPAAQIKEKSDSGDVPKMPNTASSPPSAHVASPGLGRMEVPLPFGNNSASRADEGKHAEENEVNLSDVSLHSLEDDDEENSVRFETRTFLFKPAAGVDIGGQIRQLRSGVDVAVGTPGRVIDLINRNCHDLSLTRFVILDEADMMLSMGFSEDVEIILDSVPVERQTMLFSATMPSWVKNITRKHLKNPALVDLVGDAQSGKMPDVIKCVAFLCSPRFKDSFLR